MCIYIYTYLPIYLPLNQSNNQSINQLINLYLPVCLFVCLRLSVYVRHCLSACLVCLQACLSVSHLCLSVLSEKETDGQRHVARYRGMDVLLSTARFLETTPVCLSVQILHSLVNHTDNDCTLFLGRHKGEHTEKHETNKTEEKLADLTFFAPISGRNFLPELCGKVHPDLPLSKLCAVHFALQNGALFEGRKG